MDRYLRLTPLLGVCILIETVFFRINGNGPIKPFLKGFPFESCVNQWWSALFYIQNYNNPNEVVSNRDNWDYLGWQWGQVPFS